MDTELATYVLGSGLVLLTVGQVVGFLKSRGIDLVKMSSQVNELHKWHDITDSDGVMKWYVKPSLEEAIRELSLNVAKQTVVLERMDSRLDRVLELRTSR